MERINDQIWYRMVHKLSLFIRRIPVRFFDNESIATLISQAQRSTDKLGGFVNGFLCSIGAIVTFISMGIVAYQTSPWIIVIISVYLAATLPMTIHRAKDGYRTWADVSENNRRGEYYYSRVFGEEEAREIRLLDLTGYLMNKWKENATVVQETYMVNAQHNSMF